MLPSLLNDPAGRSEDGEPEVRATLQDRFAMAVAALSVVLPGLFVALAAAALSLWIIELWL
jgi:hypothetical protein